MLIVTNTARIIRKLNCCTLRIIVIYTINKQRQFVMICPTHIHLYVGYTFGQEKVKIGAPAGAVEKSSTSFD